MKTLATRHLGCLVVAALAALVFTAGAMGDDGLPVGQDFPFPVVSDGKTVEGLAFISADRTLRIHYVKGGKIAVLTYTVTRGGDVKPPIVHDNDPPTPVVDKANKVFVIWEANNATPEGIAIANLVRRGEGWKKEAEKLGVNVVVVDVTEARKSYPGATKAAEKQGVPALVWGRDNVLLGTSPLPKDEPAMVKLLQERGGAK